MYRLWEGHVTLESHGRPSSGRYTFPRNPSRAQVGEQPNKVSLRCSFVQMQAHEVADRDVLEAELKTELADGLFWKRNPHSVKPIILDFQEGSGTVVLDRKAAFGDRNRYVFIVVLHKNKARALGAFTEIEICFYLQLEQKNRAPALRITHWDRWVIHVDDPCDNPTSASALSISTPSIATSSSAPTPMPSVTPIDPTAATPTFARPSWCAPHMHPQLLEHNDRMRVRTFADMERLTGNKHYWRYRNGDERLDISRLKNKRWVHFRPVAIMGAALNRKTQKRTNQYVGLRDAAEHAFWVAACPSSNRTLGTLVDPDLPCHFYFDVDVHPEKRPQLRRHFGCKDPDQPMTESEMTHMERQLIGEFWTNFAAVFQEVYGRPPDLSLWFCTKASRRGKLSLHIHLLSEVARNLLDLRHFVQGHLLPGWVRRFPAWDQDTKDPNNPKGHAGIDGAVYTMYRIMLTSGSGKLLKTMKVALRTLFCGSKDALAKIADLVWFVEASCPTYALRSTHPPVECAFVPSFYTKQSHKGRARATRPSSKLDPDLETKLPPIAVTGRSPSQFWWSNARALWESRPRVRIAPNGTGLRESSLWTQTISQRSYVSDRISRFFSCSAAFEDTMLNSLLADPPPGTESWGAIGDAHRRALLRMFAFTVVCRRMWCWRKTGFWKSSALPFLRQLLITANNDSWTRCAAWFETRSLLSRACEAHVAPFLPERKLDKRDIDLLKTKHVSLWKVMERIARETMDATFRNSWVDIPWDKAPLFLGDEDNKRRSQVQAMFAGWNLWDGDSPAPFTWKGLPCSIPFRFLPIAVGGFLWDTTTQLILGETQFQHICNRRAKLLDGMDQQHSPRVHALLEKIPMQVWQDVVRHMEQFHLMDMMAQHVGLQTVSSASPNDVELSSAISRLYISAPPTARKSDVWEQWKDSMKGMCVGWLLDQAQLRRLKHGERHVLAQTFVSTCSLPDAKLLKHVRVGILKQPDYDCHKAMDEWARLLQDMRSGFPNPNTNGLTCTTITKTKGQEGEHQNVFIVIALESVRCMCVCCRCSMPLHDRH